MMTVRPMPGAMTPVARILSTFNRDQLAGFIEVAIGLLDLADGDNDVEANGDELDGNMGEDDLHPQSANWNGAPGCPVSDPGGVCVGDQTDDNEAAIGAPEGQSGRWGGNVVCGDMGDGSEGTEDSLEIRRRYRSRRSRCDALPYGRYQLQGGDQ